MAEKESDPVSDTVATDLVVTKYKMAAEMVNKVLSEIVENCVPDASVFELCLFGDQRLNAETSNVYKKEKAMKKGIAFPTCISVNNCICHFSPLRSDPDIKLKDGDLIKVDLGAHIDGYIAVVAHSFIIGASKDNPVSGKKADVMWAAQQCAEAALRTVKPGNENYLVTDTIQKVSEEYGCKPIEGMLSHQLKRNVIDGEKAIIQNPNEVHRREHEKASIEVHEVYAVDILISSGEGKGREQDTRCTVYKKKDGVYNLKMKASRQFFSEIEKKCGAMPFSIRSLEDEKRARMGVVECVKHNLIDPFSVLYEREGEFVAQFKFTILLMPNGPMRITGLPFDADSYKTERKIENAEIKELLSSAVSRKAAKKKKKKAEKAAESAVAGNESAEN